MIERIRNGVLAALVLLFCSFSAIAMEPPPAHDVIAIVGVNVVPMTGDLVLTRQTVLVSGGAITTVGSEEHVRVPSSLHSGFSALGCTRRDHLSGFSAHRELQSMVVAGLTPYQALRMGTSAPAEFLRESGKFGIVATGASADLVLVDANPLADIANTQKISGVLVRGRWLSRQFIDDGLNELQQRVATTADVSDSP